MTNENIADGSVETPTVEDLQARLNKAEAKIVELKNPPQVDVKEDVKEEVNLEETITKLAEEKLNQLLRDKEDAEILANQNISNKMSIGNGAPNLGERGDLSLSEFDKLSIGKQKDYINTHIDGRGDVIFI